MQDCACDKINRLEKLQRKTMVVKQLSQILAGFVATNHARQNATLEGRSSQEAAGDKWAEAKANLFNVQLREGHVDLDAGVPDREQKRSITIGLVVAPRTSLERLQSYRTRLCRVEENKKAPAAGAKGIRR